MIELDKDGGLWVVRINRPDKANSLTETMLAQLADVAEGATEVGAKALILTGTGRVFSAGADLDEARAGLATSPVWERLSAAVAAFPGLSVAALNGTLAGGRVRNGAGL
jgi:enoyl-CoA hydratase